MLGVCVRAFVCENDLFVRLSLAQNQNVSYACRQQFDFEE